MELDREQCARAERFANEQIWRNVKVDILYRDREHMDDLDVRKVTDKVDGVLRLVVIEGGDVCTCCGTHVERTGEVGMIKILRGENRGRNTRMCLFCLPEQTSQSSRLLNFIKQNFNFFHTFLTLKWLLLCHQSFPFYIFMFVSLYLLPL
jgi:alanyl-tRNA synthetase